MCSTEITKDNGFQKGNARLTADLIRGDKDNKGTLLSVEVEVITAKNNVWNDGDFCKYCVLDALYKLDDRPMEM